MSKRPGAHPPRDSGVPPRVGGRFTTAVHRAFQQALRVRQVWQKLALSRELLQKHPKDGDSDERDLKSESKLRVTGHL